ncbi:MAG: 3'-5' exonuclease, partial [Pseudonocardiaceae bacterium]
MSHTRPWSTQRYLVVDVEGNGARPPDLVELGIVPITDGAVGAPVSWLVRPDAAITPMARRIHGITNDHGAAQPTFEAIHAEVLAYLANVVIVGHNVHIDLGVLRRKLPDWQPAATLDTLRLARKLLPDLPSH